MKLGQLLKFIRTSKEMTQKEMASLIGISQNYLSLIESGTKNPSSDKLSDFAEALQISKDALIFVSSNPPEELSGKDQKKYEQLQNNIVSLLLFELTGETENNA
ncbi:putative transcriptional regulator [Desulforapulum autotrophicum HRM2]|uniref:Transcriptional regulator n=1 Tax=Desulforapulum autotrophicum (strain ATCC 43914 / DSM 3382 / VKM B-1955 / HRM2) TaxID=177437 RepID=C0QC07_DESAH|nr:helix-turn-helix transcriptional regulator [Desulforapulum autotrophicum]ACN15019.1 putative transcriptional regulator [Desulforapulum autotrophicum HRM2]